MATKVVVIGDSKILTQEKIEFVSFLSENKTCINTTTASPSDWLNIELVCKNYKGSKLDLMFAYDTDREDSCLFLGRFNDGIV